jgi:hypothetical protein
MSTTKKERNKDIPNFLRLCKDIFKYIKKKIIKRYVYPETNSIPSKLNSQSENEKWKYFNIIEEVTVEDTIYDIFKDDTFLAQVQKFYESLEIVISSLEENKKNYECLKKNIEVGEKKIQLLSELNSQLNQYFNSNVESMSIQDANDINSINKPPNVISHLSLVKSFTILNDLKLMNSINDLNSQEITGLSSNSVINDNKSINNEKIEPTKDNKKNELEKDSNLLSKKKKRVKNNEKYIDIITHNSSVKSSNNSDLADDNIKDKKDLALVNSQIKKEEKNNEKNIINNLIDKINISTNHSKEESVMCDCNSTLTFDNNTISNKNNKYIEISNKEITQSNTNNNNNSNIMQNSINNFKNKDNGEAEFEKILKNEFSSVYSDPNNIQSNSEILQEIKKILKKIPQIKFPNNHNKFEDPSLIGSHKNFDTKYLLDSLPSIDILFKCNDIESMDEVNSIIEDTMSKKMHLSYIEICQVYDEESKIVKVTNKCKIKIKDNYFFIYINLFFVNIKISSYNKIEHCIDRFKFSNELYNNKDKILMCLFFRRWRRKFKLFFIVPEFLDIIINFYFNEKNSFSSMIENIFYDLFNGDFNFHGNNNVNIDDEANIKEINGFIKEWYNNPEHKIALNSAISTTNELLLKNDFLSVVKID